MARAPELRIAGDRVRVVQGRRATLEAPLGELVEGLSRGARRPACPVLPRGLRLLAERRGATAVAIEVPPHARTVRWLADDSPAPYGPDAVYRDCYLGFPYVVVLAVFIGGRISGVQQVFYRTRPLEPGGDDELLLPNLFNVAEAYGQRCWLCLQHLRRLRARSWGELAEAVGAHLFNAAFNRSAEEHEGHSYWQRMREVDPRVASVAAWEQATRANPWFALEVPWQPAGTTARAELLAMLDVVACPFPENPTATDLAGLLLGARGQEGLW